MLYPNATLEALAYEHAAWMDEARTMSHTQADGTTFAQRMQQSGLSYSAAAENIAMGDVDEKGVFRMWTGSSGHRANIRNERLTAIGYAKVGRYHCAVYAAVGVATGVPQTHETPDGIDKFPSQ